LKKFWEFKAKQDAPSEGELLLYGDISSSTWWGDEVTPIAFAQDLKSLGDISTLNIYINSGGGDVFAGQAIYSMLKRHPAQKNVYIDGLGASIASVIAMAGDTVFMPKNAMMMIHKAWTMAIGNANDLRKLADDMDKIDESILTTYQDKTGLEPEKIIDMVNAETWLTAEEAVALGFADIIEGTRQIAASLNKDCLTMNGLSFDLSKFRNAPKQAVACGPEPHNAGRTLSAANEERIVQARDLLGEVLNQLGGSKNDPPPKASETSQVPVYLYEKLNLNNRRKANV
jgi:ATP-dependent Clp protease, protease subunit